MNTSTHITVASFTVPEQNISLVVEQARLLLKSVGIESYVIEVAGSCEPILDYEGITYVGEQEISSVVQELTSEHSIVKNLL